MVKLFKALPALLFAMLTAAQQFAVTVPSPTNWWVAKSNNVLTWTCQLNTQYPTFSVLLNNTSPTVLTGPLALISIQQNTDCSVPVALVNVIPTTGYTVFFADDVNNTNVYFTSQEFEIKALGSAYPSTTSSVASFTGTGSVLAGVSPTGTSGTPGAHIPSFFGLAGFMGLLTAGLLGA